MASLKKTFVCQKCGAVTTKWAGQCGSCGSWNSVEEVATTTSRPKSLGQKKGHVVPLINLAAETLPPPRISGHIGELDRVLGGGIVPGSAILVGGDPGIGKSTLLIQLAANLSNSNQGCIYISGEEATDQIRLRAQRLGLAQAPVQLASATSVRDIITTVLGQPDQNYPPSLLIIDSIQTMFMDTIESASGTVSQVRASAQELIGLAKSRGIALVLVGHVTKDGQIAGPRVLEHMVDTVLYFEGDRGHQFRILRAVKNRFGPANEIGVFEMADSGLNEVPNPSVLFLSTRESPVSGTAVFAGMEGTRPVLVEIEALVAPSPMATPRRAVVGLESARMAMIIAVLEARCHISFTGMEVYLNVAGGLRINEPAADLAVAAALISAVTDEALPAQTVLFGEIALSGELRPVGQADARLREAFKLGFQNAVLPRAASIDPSPIKLSQLITLVDLLKFFDEKLQQTIPRCQNMSY